MYETELPAALDPNDPAAVVQLGASETVNIALDDLTALPSLFSTLIKYVPSVAKVNCAAIEVELVKVTESACVITPVELIASTIGADTKLVPVIVIDVCALVITLGLIPVIVGFVSPTVTLPPRLTALPLIVILSFAILALVTASSSICVVVIALLVPDTKFAKSLAFYIFLFYYLAVHGTLF